MKQQLVIIRGNSGSGKTTIARHVREAWGEKVMFLQQDVLRRDILKVKDTEGNPVIGLIEQLTLYGKNQGYNVIIEGIFAEKKYGNILRRLVEEFEVAHVYYLEVPFEETLIRHSSRPVSSEFGEAEMREWWIDKDYLGISQEVVIHNNVTAEDVVIRIIKDTKRYL